MRTFLVTVTREADFTILAESKEDIYKALDGVDEYELNNDWDLPDWEFRVIDTIGETKKVERLPKVVSGFDMAVIDGELLSSDEYGENKQKILRAIEKAEKDLADLRLKLGMEKVQIPLPFEDK